MDHRQTITLYEPVSGTFIIITALVLLFSGTLGKMLYSNYERDCHQRNAILLEHNRQGPIQECK